LAALIFVVARFLYLFLDESGNLAFKPEASGSSRFFIITSVATEHPFDAAKALHDLRYELLQKDAEMGECFHASEDKQRVRDEVFTVIQAHLSRFVIDSIIIEKRKTGPPLQDLYRFYPQMLGYLLRFVMRQYELELYDKVIVIAASLFAGQHKGPAEKAVKTTLARMLPTGTRYRLFHHSAKSDFDLQLADYCSWAIYKKWTVGEERPYKLIAERLRSEFDIFQRGQRFYY
jgi:hypothetical protein